MQEGIVAVFNLSILFSLAGGLLGSILVIDHKRYGWAMTLLFIAVGMIMAASITDYFFSRTNGTWVNAGVGIFVSMAGTALLDAFKAAAPKMANKVIEAVTNRAVNIIGGGNQVDNDKNDNQS